MTDYTELCRVCLRRESQYTGHLLPIEKTRIHLGTISLLDALKLFISFEYNKDERIPQRICTSCVKDITNGYVFKLKFEAAERFLLKEVLNIVLPPCGGRKKDKCVSTADLNQEYETLLEVAAHQPEQELGPESQQEPEHHQDRNPKPVKRTIASCKVEDDIIEAARAQNVIHSYTQYVKPDQYQPPSHQYQHPSHQYQHPSHQYQHPSHQYQPPPHPYQPPPHSQNNYFEVVQDPMTGESVYSYNAPGYSSYEVEYTHPYEEKYSHNYPPGQEDQNMEHSNYISKIEVEDHQLIENMDDIIEHEEYATENEDLDHDYNEVHVDDKETADAVKAITKSPEKGNEQQTVKKGKRRRARRPTKCKQRRVITTKTLNCIACEETYENIDSVRNHFLESHTHGQFCSFCNRAIISSMYRHVSAHFKGDKIKCPKCDKECCSELALLHHSTKHHPTFECPECHHKLNNQEEFNDHVAEHKRLSEEALAANGVEYEAKRMCETCNEIFDNQAAVKAHFLAEHIDGGHCKVCDITMPLKNVKVHITDHFRRDKFFCEKCRKRFHTSVSLKQHQVEQHNGHGICQYCLLEFETKEQFDNHTIEHELAGTVGWYRCRKCGVVLSTFAALVNHQTAHEEEKYKCKDCRHAFKKEFDYKKHLAIGHKKKCKPYCKLCRVIV